MSQNASLQKQHSELETYHDQLVTAHEDLQHSHESLQADHDALEKLHEQLASEYEALISEHGSLKANHKTLRGDVSSWSIYSFKIVIKNIEGYIFMVYIHSCTKNEKKKQFISLYSENASLFFVVIRGRKLVLFM